MCDFQTPYVISYYENLRIRLKMYVTIETRLTSQTSFSSSSAEIRF